ncbi:MAG TPA: Cache 3/Cache 2 fusion domain-containing protein [Spirochaetales bacterium]|nr:Cache 3/Cache 2 fusion domain-containing protein [Spirochaetales bacterium]HRY55812.1 Cache 3/Cache 2 fusion domain-containing protein [Spirochaetia bacterium]HRZ64406.1 Cache 3/Cache 2 fusion domain-containing protein [Spirochaetia bacterium]
MRPPAPRRTPLGGKVAALGAGAAMVAVLAMVAIALRQSRAYESLAIREIDALIAEELDQVTSAAYRLVRAEDEAVKQELESALRLARRSLEVSGETAEIAAGRFRPERLARVVEEISELGWSAATVFRRESEAGDMIRVATTVRDASGRPAVGTRITARGPGGGPDPVIAAVLGGGGYRGRAFVVDRWYIAAYEPLRSASGRVVGMLFVGVPQAKAEARIREAIVSTKVGKTGYLYVVSGLGENRGTYIVSKGGERDGESLWDVRDPDGEYIVRGIIEEAVKLGPGEMNTLRYRWQNPGESEPRWRSARIAYYAPWDWVIGLSVYEDEILSYRGIMSAGRRRMVGAMAAAGGGVAILVGAAAWLVSLGITGPLKRMAASAELLARGGRAQEVESRGSDELGALASAFNAMSRRIEGALAVLRASEAKYRGIFENATEGIMLTDPAGACLDANPAMTRMLGFRSAEELVAAHTNLGSSFYADEAERALLLDKLLAEGRVSNEELRARRADGSAIWVSISARFEPGEPRRILALVSDIDERRRADEARRESLIEKDALLHEIHHRVKNNLQLIASLLAMQSRAVSDPASLALYEDFSNRVLAMAQIHEQLYESEGFARVDFGAYARDLAASLRQNYAACSAEALLEVEAEDVELEMNRAVTCGLLVNEILTNSLRHAFPPARRPEGGRISLRLSLGAGGSVLLELSDDGVGIPAGLGLGDTAHLGLALIPLLAAQLGAELELDRSGGTAYRIRFAAS